MCNLRGAGGTAYRRLTEKANDTLLFTVLLTGGGGGTIYVILIIDNFYIFTVIDMIKRLLDTN